MLAVTAGWAWVLLGRSPGWYPWLRVAILVAALGAAAAILAPRRPLAALAGAGRGRLFLAAVPVSLAMVAGLGGPLGYSINTAATAHTGALPSAGPAVAAGFGPGRFGGFGNRFRGAAGGGFPAGAGAGGGAAGLGGSSAGGQGGGQFPGGSSGGQAGTGQFPGGSFGGQGGTGQFPGGLGSGQGGTGRFPGRFGGRGFGGGGGLGGNTQVSSALTRLLTAGSAGYTWAAATVGSESAAPLQLATGKPVLAIGGFNGTDPTPTLAHFERLVADHKIHYFVGQNRSSFGGGSGAASQIASWVESHFTARTVGGVNVYDLASS
jgi:hypothetical protein